MSGLTGDWDELIRRAHARVTPSIVVLAVGAVVVVAAFGLSMISVISGNSGLSVGSVVAAVIFGVIVGGASTGLFWMVHSHGFGQPLALDGLVLSRRRAVWRAIHRGQPSDVPLLRAVEEQAARRAVTQGMAGARIRITILLAEAILLLLIGLIGGLPFLVNLAIAVVVAGAAGIAALQQRRAVDSGARYLAAIGVPVAPIAVPARQGIGQRARRRS